MILEKTIPITIRLVSVKPLHFRTVHGVGYKLDP
jgi:hypothetical protein